MLRTFLVELALFLTPFILYGLLLLVTRGSFVPEHWSPRALTLLSLSAIVLMIAGLFVFERERSSPPGSRYVPAHMENGTFMPGHFE